jgi:hypothetical protein
MCSSMNVLNLPQEYGSQLLLYRVTPTFVQTAANSPEKTNVRGPWGNYDFVPIASIAHVAFHHKRRHLLYQLISNR